MYFFGTLIRVKSFQPITHSNRDPGVINREHPAARVYMEYTLEFIFISIQEYWINNSIILVRHLKVYAQSLRAWRPMQTDVGQFQLHVRWNRIHWRHLSHLWVSFGVCAGLLWLKKWTKATGELLKFFGLFLVFILLWPERKHSSQKNEPTKRTKLERAG